MKAFAGLMMFVIIFGIVVALVGLFTYQTWLMVIGSILFLVGSIVAVVVFPDRS